MGKHLKVSEQGPLILTSQRDKNEDERGQEEEGNLVALPVPSPPDKPSALRLLAALSEHERPRALARYELIQPCVEGGVFPAAVARQHGLPDDRQ